tara:strand:+ start:161 stop:496 length:336 start_codon:yes stop_codon:yes gene_type:complete
MCTGQILFKKTALILSQSNLAVNFNKILETFITLIKIPYFFLALIVYASATLFWLFILQKIPLSIAYPFTALAMVIIPILSIFLFQEKLSFNYWIGAAFIVIGIFIISIKS